MPYIKQNRRIYLDDVIDDLVRRVYMVEEEDRDGELNYIITMLLRKVYYEPKYHRYNTALGILEAVKLELYRRLIADYEDRKKEENGDVG